MNIGIFATHYLWPSHFETDLELLQQNLDSKNKVFFYNCNKCIKNCELIWNLAVEQNVTIDQIKNATCFQCQEKQQRGYSLIKGQFVLQSILFNKQNKKKYIIADKELESADTLKKLVIDNNYEIGWSLMSSLISMYRNPFISPKDHKKEVSTLYQDCCRIYYSTKQYIKENNLEKIYLFSGRLSYTRAILSAAKTMNIDYYVHERGSDFTKYSLFQNHTIHNLEKITERIKEAWEIEKDEDIKNNIGSQFFKDRENNIIGSWSSFLDNQDKNLLPSNWNDKIQNITLFSSSEDEFASVSDEWSLSLFKSQLEGIKFISDYISTSPNTHLYIRVHPNTKNMSDNYKLLLSSFSGNKSTTLINYDSSVSSYALLKKSNKIITFGSTLGIEAVYWGKPSILLGKAYYFNLKGVIVPKDHNELINLLTQTTIDIPIINDALKFGYFMKTFGVKYEHYTPIDYKSGFYEGINLEEQLGTYKLPLRERVTNRIKKLIN
ncbi:MAG: hypothetical protein HXX14_13110 [Bacteroidetes bacterium]|nr:hypothetical protein [Bacteroidota bacterium]